MDASSGFDASATTSATLLARGLADATTSSVTAIARSTCDGSTGNPQTKLLDRETARVLLPKSSTGNRFLVQLTAREQPREAFDRRYLARRRWLITLHGQRRNCLPVLLRTPRGRQLGASSLLGSRGPTVSESLATYLDAVGAEPTVTCSAACCSPVLQSASSTSARIADGASSRLAPHPPPQHQGPAPRLGRAGPQGGRPARSRDRRRRGHQRESAAGDQGDRRGLAGRAGAISIRMPVISPSPPGGVTPVRGASPCRARERAIIQTLYVRRAGGHRARG